MGPVANNGGPIQLADNSFGNTATDGTYGSPDDANPDSGSYISDSGGDMSGAQRDPLVIDLTGKGLNLTPRSATSPYFDFTGSGFAHNSGWIAAGTGFLALAGADGLVHDGRQLFGTGGQSGFDALRALDSNGDGVIDAQDAAFGKLVVWQDQNGDGVCRPGEVSTLAQLGITSISLHTSTVFQTVGNATVIGTALATMADGSTREVAEANLSISATYTQFVGNYDFDPGVLALPQLQGYGSLPSLWASMSQDGQLKTLVQQLVQVSPSSPAAFDAAMRAALFRWAGVDGVAPASGYTFDGQELGFLRKLLGNTDNFVGGGVPVFTGQSNLMQKAWDEAYAGLKARVLVQLPNSPFASYFYVDWGTDLLVPAGQLTSVIAGLAPQAPADPAAQVGYWSNALLLVSTSVSDLAQYATPNTGAITASLQAVVPALFSPEVLAAAAAGKLIVIEDMALGGKQVGTRGADLVLVEQHNAAITAFGGGDEFVVSTGLGAVEINEADNAAGAHNVLLLSGVAPSQVAVSGNTAGDIVLTLAGGDTVKLDNMLASFASGYQEEGGHSYNILGAGTHYGVQEVRFGDGTVWTAAQIVQREVSATGNGGDALYGTNGADVLDGQGLKHLLQGNGGGDTFVFQAGYGALELKEADSGATPANVLQLGAGIRPDQVTVTGNAAGDVLLTIGAGGDAIKLDGMLASRGNGMQQVRFDDGTVWTAKQMLTLADVGSVGNISLVDLTGGATLDPAGYAHLGSPHRLLKIAR